MMNIDEEKAREMAGEDTPLTPEYLNRKINIVDFTLQAVTDIFAATATPDQLDQLNNLANWVNKKHEENEGTK